MVGLTSVTSDEDFGYKTSQFAWNGLTFLKKLHWAKVLQEIGTRWLFITKVLVRLLTKKFSEIIYGMEKVDWGSGDRISWDQKYKNIIFDFWSHEQFFWLLVRSWDQKSKKHSFWLSISWKIC